MSTYPAKNRPADEGDLGAIDIDITSGIGTDRYDPNRLIVAAFEGHLDALVPVEGLKSDISGEPAVVYRTSEVEVHITPGELKRMTMRSLAPSEVFALLNKYGDFFEIHEDFYDFSNGAALQSKAHLIQRRRP